MAEHPVLVVAYGLLVSCGILGNSAVISVTMDSTCERNRLSSSDLILINIAVANLLLSLTRNTLLLTLDAGLPVSFSSEGCRLMMFVWTWLRSTSIWVTLSLSWFHFVTVRTSRGALERLSERRRVIALMAAEWGVNLVYSGFALGYSSNSTNSTNHLAVISSTIRPLLGCVWTFPTKQSGFIYALVSVVVHEAIPVVLMLYANAGTLLFLYQHHRKVQDSQLAGGDRISHEWRAAKTILYLIGLFVFCWGTHVLSVNYYNFKGSPSTHYLLVIARFSASGFIGLYPLVVAMGHSKLKHRLKNILKCLCP
eukprot:gi/632976994/ref/XP_007905102.1/ PREDICTED: vomeronasal type-1 receptor 4 [Callorhinchus milii]